SKDDSPGEGPDPTDPIEEKAQLLLTASAQEITVGQEVAFEVTAEGVSVGADIYINDTLISGTAHTFAEVGSFGAVAKKEGYLESEEVRIGVQAEKKKVAQATFSKLGTQPYPITYQGEYYDRISLMGEHIYLMTEEQGSFGRYSLASDQWEELT